MQHWSKLDYHKDPCPVERNSHSAVCIGYGGDHPQLLVTGGLDNGDNVLSDGWMLDVESRRWREVRINKALPIIEKYMQPPRFRFWVSRHTSHALA